jgi:hypothetical protein
MNDLDSVAIDNRLKRLEAAILGGTGNVDASTTSTGGAGFYDAPVLIDKSTGANDMRSWTPYTMPDGCPSGASAVILSWAMEDHGGDFGIRRIELSIDGGANVFLVGQGEIELDDADFGMGATSGLLPCRHEGTTVAFDYRVWSNATGDILTSWSLWAIGWIA